MADANSNIVPIKGKRGGARSGAGRKPGSLTKENGRFVYVIHEVDNPTVCKIGVANDPVRRLRSHQVSTWRRLKLAGAFTAESAKAAMAIEGMAHKALWGVHVSGEWFRASADRAEEEVMAAASCSGLSIRRFQLGDLNLIKINQDD